MAAISRKLSCQLLLTAEVEAMAECHATRERTNCVEPVITAGISTS